MHNEAMDWQQGMSAHDAGIRLGDEARVVRDAGRRRKV